MLSTCRQFVGIAGQPSSCWFFFQTQHRCPHRTNSTQMSPYDKLNTDVPIGQTQHRCPHKTNSIYTNIRVLILLHISLGNYFFWNERTTLIFMREKMHPLVFSELIYMYIGPILCTFQLNIHDNIHEEILRIRSPFIIDL